MPAHLSLFLALLRMLILLSALLPKINKSVKCILLSRSRIAFDPSFNALVQFTNLSASSYCLKGDPDRVLNTGGVGLRSLNHTTLYHSLNILRVNRFYGLHCHRHLSVLLWFLPLIELSVDNILGPQQFAVSEAVD
jgi:hypothetical protein